MIKVAGLFMAICMVAGTAHAAPLLPDRCEKALVPNIESGFYNESDRYLFLYTLDESSFERIKHNLDSNTQLVVSGIPINQGTKWSDFQEQRKAKLENIKIDASRDVVSQWYSSKLTRDNFAAYSECMRKDAVGFNPFVQEISGNLITIAAVFNTAQGDDKPRKVSIQVVNAEVMTKGDKMMKRGSQQAWVLQRSSPNPIAVTFSVTVNDNESAQSLPIITEPPIVQVAKTIIKLDQTLYKPNPGQRSDYPDEAYVNAQGQEKSQLCYHAPIGFKIIPNTDTLVWHEQAGATMSAAKGEATEEHVCYNLFSQSNSDGHGSGIAQIFLRVATDQAEYVDLK